MSRGTLDPACCHPISPTGLSPPAAGFPKTVRLSSDNALCSPQPQVLIPGLGSSHFARRYFGNRCFSLFLALLRCFSSGGSLYTAMDSLYSRWSLSSGVSPFRNLRVNGYLLLTAAYRSLSRLSSALSAKAFTLCSLLLDLYRFTLLV